MQKHNLREILLVSDRLLVSLIVIFIPTRNRIKKHTKTKQLYRKMLFAYLRLCICSSTKDKVVLSAHTLHEIPLLDDKGQSALHLSP